MAKVEHEMKSKRRGAMERNLAGVDHSSSPFITPT